MEGLIITVVVGAGVVLGNALARLLKLPAPLVLVVVGFVAGFVPGATHLAMPPEVVLLLFLPVLLFWESLTTSIAAIKEDLGPIVVSSTLFVVATAFFVAAATWWAGLPWASALILGAAVAPPDATAAAALAKGLPRRQFMMLKAESLTNDGTALVVYGIAVGLALGTHYTPLHIAELTVRSFLGGILIGIATALLAAPILRRLRDPILKNLSLILVPFGAFLVAELVEASGVLAVVIAGLILSAMSNLITNHTSRMQAEQAWPLATTVLNGALFLLIGVQIRVLVFRFQPAHLATLVGIAVAVAVALVVSRFLFLRIAAGLAGLLVKDPSRKARHLSWRSHVVSAVSAFRGGVSLAIALSIPHTLGDGTPFPHRDEVVLVTAFAIVLGMAVQGPLLPRLIRWSTSVDDQLNEEYSEEEQVQRARRAIHEQLRLELPQIAADAGASDEVRARLELVVDQALKRFASQSGEETDDLLEEVERIHRVVLSHKRAILARMRRSREVSDEVARIVRMQIDLEELRRDGFVPYE